MITYILNAIGVDASMISSEFTLFSGLLIVIISVFAICKVLFIIFNEMFGGM